MNAITIFIAAPIALLTFVMPAAAQQADTLDARFSGSFAVAAAPPAPAAEQKLAGPALKAQATVTGDLVRIGDLIDNAGAAADVPIFRAPNLGYTGNVPASRVVDAVRPHHIIGLDTRGIAEVVVTRASQTVTSKDIEARIVRALAGQYGLADAGSLGVIFDNDMRTLHVEPGASADLRIARLTFEPRTGRFDVWFDLAGTTATRRGPMRFTGSIAETVEAAMLTRQIAQGEVLKASDMTITRRPKAELTAGGVISAEQAIGLASRRMLRAGQVIRQADLIKPELVQRNETVMLTYEVPGIRLTLRGKALESGAHGDLISVLNVQSNKTIQATVTGPGRVSAIAATSRVAVNASNRPIPSSSAR